MKIHTPGRTMSILRALALTALSCSSAFAQIYLIVGKPTPKDISTFAADLLTVNLDGSVQHVEQLASQKEGMWWIESAEDSRTVVMTTAAPDFKVIVVDMDLGKVVKRCERWPEVPGYLSPEIWPTEQWLVADGTGRLFVGHYGSRGYPDTVLQGLALDPAVSCESSFKMLGPSDVARVYKEGSGGIGYLTGIVGPTLLIDSDGSIHTRIGRDRIYLGYTVPREYWQDMGVPLAGVYANNPKVLVIEYWDGENSSLRRTIAYDKINRKWSELPLPGIPAVRAFGSTLAMSESVRPVPGDKTPRTAKTTRRQTDSKNGPRTSYVFEFSEEVGFVYTGRLHVYDVATGKRSTIVTNEEDSEVLLVEEETIYYRVNDGLYSSKLGASGFMPGLKIATDERILDAHWAFMK